MSKKTLTVELPEDIYERFIETVTKEGGPWRGRRKEETSTGAVESAVYAALILFLQGLDGDSELPEFRDYAAEKYPYLDEDQVTRIDDLIKREKERLTKKG
jgi:hypothetical protein